MYTVNQRQHRHKIILRFFLFVFPFLIALGALVWFFIFRNSGDSASFTQPGTKVAAVEVETKVFSNDLFKITLPSTWIELGRKNPTVYEVYYEFQNGQKDYDNRWVKVYVDVFPESQAINRLLPVSVVNNRLLPGSTVSENCRTFTGAPTSNGQADSQTWKAKWMNIEFVCDVQTPRNYVGTASANEGYGTTLVSTTGRAHKYFLLYIDHNINPEYQAFINAVKSFEVL